LLGTGIRWPERTSGEQRAPVRHADANSHRSVRDFGPLDRRAQVNLCNLLRSEPPVDKTGAQQFILFDVFTNERGRYAPLD